MIEVKSYLTPNKYSRAGRHAEMDVRMHETALALLGTDAGLLPPVAPPEAAGWLDGFLFSLAGPIYAGTNEVMKLIIARAVLGG